MGPTAAGKTELTLDLCARFPFAVISVDAAQVYRGLDIGTAKPAADALSVVPHRLIDIRPPNQTYSVAEFRRDALAAMADIVRGGRIPLLVGGSMFYFRTLESDLSELPSAAPVLRALMAQRAADVGWPALHRELAAVDPANAARIDPNDAQRIQRALEIYRLTGRRLEQAPRRAGHLPYRVMKLAVAPSDRSVLHQRIEKRFADMLKLGFVDEVRGLLQTPGVHPGLAAMRTVGYRQIVEFLHGELSYNDMISKGIAATRQLGKRQLTWLRNQGGVTWVDSAGIGAGNKGMKDSLWDYMTGKLKDIGGMI
ncbi:MAG: tRNA (adenosine(37)-N6)-dimethylallyltransferase MiaA [Gammaproteobacteria bacterium]|nr:tRNA (adenosine(37)-N6)-dimethylallyltransferase MiaA [Gammaproteobacteria bacterium]